MKHIAYRRVRLSAIRAPGDIGKRQKLPRVAAMAKSIRDGALLQPVIVDADYNLVAGRDRYAAHLLNEAKSVDVHVLALTEQEKRLVELQENSYRRHAPEEQKEAQDELQKLLAQYEQQFSEEKPKPKKRKRGPPKTAAGKAVDKLAKEIGKDPRAVYMKNYRQKQKELTGFELYDLEIDQDFRQEMVDTIHACKSASRSMKAAAGELAKLVDKEYSIPYGPMNQIRTVLEELAGKIADMAPASMCAYCKVQTECRGTKLLEKCVGCEGRGWLPQSAMAGVPKELKDPDTVVVNGQFVKLDPADGQESEDFNEDAVAGVTAVMTEGFDDWGGAILDDEPNLPDEDMIW